MNTQPQHPTPLTSTEGLRYLVRLHRLDENSAADVSGLLGFLRELNRRHNLALVEPEHTERWSCGEN